MDEYISRESLLKNLNTFAPEKYDALVNTLIQNEPAADVRPVVRGKWMKPKGFKTRCQCSECKVHPVRGNPNFCPNCGADMREDIK